MFASKFTLFSESRLWECRVFTVFGDRQVRFDCIFTGFADKRLWEYRIFLFKNAFLAQKGSCFSFDFLFVLAPCGFARLCEALGGISRLWPLGSSGDWEALEGSFGFARFCKAFGGFVGQS